MKFPFSRLSFISKIEAKWFGRTWLISILAIIIYLLLHKFIDGESNWKYLNKEQLAVAISILEDKPQDSVAKGELILYLNLIMDMEETPEPINNKGRISYKEAIHQFSPEEIKLILPTMPFRVKSMFWLSGYKIIWEMIFWSFFGLSCSILFRATEAIRNQDFEPRKIPIHIAKIIYAPFSAIVIIFSVNVLTSDNGQTFERMDHGVIVLAFILGFYSGRTIELLRRVKDLILPLGTDSQTARKDKGKMYKAKGKLSLPRDIDINLESDEFLSQIKVYVESVDNINIENISAQVNAKGEFEFPFLYGGKYILYAQLKSEKHWLYKKQFLEIDEEVENKEINIILNELYVS